MKHKLIILISVLSAVFALSSTPVGAYASSQILRDTTERSKNDSLVPDSIPTAPYTILPDTTQDTLTVDTTRRSSSALDMPVTYEAQDSITFDYSKMRATLFGSSKVTYTNLELTADRISMSMDSSLVHATGTPDSTGAIKGKPLFKQGEDEYEPDEIDYNFKTGKAYISNVYTEQGEGFMMSEGGKRDSTGVMYVEKYFPAEAKERMITLVRNLQESLGERIQALEWMGDSTKVKALEKLATFHVKIGYPDKWKDYSTLDIKDDSFIANMERANLWSHAEMLDKVGKPVDKEEWHMTPQTVNAYYNPTTNEICFPAGILQYPFFDMNADDAFNYGAIGVVIGHEMTHGFDDQGRKYDKDGNLKDWWTEQDAKNFDERAKVMIDFFDKIEVAPGVNANGQMTLGENIADHGGLQVAFHAFKNATKDNPLPVKEGFTPEQRFFFAYSNVWAGNITDAEIVKRTLTDVHSLGKWRVNGALPHISAWYEAFGITENDALYLAPEKRVSIW